MKQITLFTIMNQYKVPQIFKDWMYEISQSPAIEIQWHILLDCTVYIIGEASWGTGIKLAINFSRNNLWIKDVNKILLPENQYQEFKEGNYEDFIATANWMLD